MHIRVKLNDDPQTWGTDGGQAVATLAAEKMAAVLEDILTEQYPDANIDISVVATESPDAIQVFRAGEYYSARHIEGEVLDTITALHPDMLAAALAEIDA